MFMSMSSRWNPTALISAVATLPTAMCFTCSPTRLTPALSSMAQPPSFTLSLSLLGHGRSGTGGWWPHTWPPHRRAPLPAHNQERHSQETSTPFSPHVQHQQTHLLCCEDMARSLLEGQSTARALQIGAADIRRSVPCQHC